MFKLVELKDTVRITPSLFSADLRQSIEEELNLKLANKVMINIGLCIAVFDITSIGESHILPKDGASYTTVQFTCVVFRPFLDEILIGKIRSSSREGVVVSLGFFDDILIPNDALPTPSRFDEKEQLWVWEYTNDDEGEDKVHDMFMDRDEPIRFRVIDEIFQDTSPSGPNQSNVAEMEKKIPYSILGSISDPGLGLLSWWE